MPLILSRDRVRPFPSIPAECVVPADFNEEQARDLQWVWDLLFLWVNPEGKRRTETGLNRAAQIKWPERGWKVDYIYTIADTWFLGGWPCVVLMIRRGKSTVSDDKWYSRIDPEISEFGAKEVDALPSAETEIIALSSYARLFQNEHPTPPPYRVFDVIARGKYGIYHFKMGGLGPPENLADVDYLCGHHNRIEEFPVV